MKDREPVSVDPGLRRPRVGGRHLRFGDERKTAAGDPGRVEDLVGHQGRLRELLFGLPPEPVGEIGDVRPIERRRQHGREIGSRETVDREMSREDGAGGNPGRVGQPDGGRAAIGIPGAVLLVQRRGREHDEERRSHQQPGRSEGLARSGFSDGARPQLESDRHRREDRDAVPVGRDDRRQARDDGRRREGERRRDPGPAARPSRPPRRRQRKGREHQSRQASHARQGKQGLAERGAELRRLEPARRVESGGEKEIAAEGSQARPVRNRPARERRQREWQDDPTEREGSDRARRQGVDPAEARLDREERERERDADLERVVHPPREKRADHERETEGRVAGAGVLDRSGRAPRRDEDGAGIGQERRSALRGRAPRGGSARDAERAGEVRRLDRERAGGVDETRKASVPDRLALHHDEPRRRPAHGDPPGGKLQADERRGVPPPGVHVPGRIGQCQAGAGGRVRESVTGRGEEGQPVDGDPASFQRTHDVPLRLEVRGSPAELPDRPRERVPQRGGGLRRRRSGRKRQAAAQKEEERRCDERRRERGAQAADHRRKGSSTPRSFAVAIASGYPASACRITPVPGSAVRTRRSRRSAPSVPSATTTMPAWIE